MASFVKAAQTSDIPAGQGKCVEVEGKRIAIFNVDGTYYAIDDVCPHQGGPLSEGELSGTTVTCPWHGWRFRVRDGVWADNPRVKIGCYELRIVGEEVQLRVGG